MSPPRVLSVIHAPHLGGPQRRNLALAQRFAADGQADLTVALPDGPAADVLRAAKVTVVAVPLGRVRATCNPVRQLRYLAGWPGDVARLNELIRAARADVVLLNGLANPQAAVAARRAGAALVWQILDSRTPPALVRLLRPWVRAWADCVMTTGPELATAQLALNPSAADAPLAGRIVPFAPPVDADRFRPDPAIRAAVRAELGVGDRPVVGMIANLTPQKGHDAFLDAAAALRRVRPDTAFVWLGARFDGQAGYADRLLARAARLGLDDLIVRTPGARVADLAQAFDVAWLTSPARSEGIPTAVGEAMALGLPLVGFRVGAVAALVTPGESGLLHPPGAVAGLARDTAALFADPKRRAAIGAAARRAARQICSPGACAEAHLRAFEIARAHRRASASLRELATPRLNLRLKGGSAGFLGRFNQLPRNSRVSAASAADQEERCGGAAVHTRRGGDADMTRMAMNRQPRAATPSFDGAPLARTNGTDRAGPGGRRAGAARPQPSLKILILALNSAPDPVGAGKVTGEMAAWLAERGHTVEVVSAPPYYPGWRLADAYRGAGYRRETAGGITTLRCPIYVPSRPTGPRRLLHHLSFALTSLPAVVARALLGRPDVVLTVAPSMLAAPNAWLAARLSGARAWLHVQDLELDAAVELGLVAPGQRHGWAAALEARLLRRFDRVSTIGPGMAERLAAKGVEPRRLGVLANWVNCRAIRPLPERQVTRAAFGLPDDAFLALYSGSLGDKQGLEVLIDAAERLVHRRDLQIAVFGEGPARRRLLDAAAQLPNLTVGPLVPADRLNDLLNCADVHLLPQAAGIQDLVLPSKLTHMLASGRPVIAAAPAESQLAALVGDCGLRLEANDGAAFARAVERLAADPVLRRSLGRSARERAVEQLERDTVLGRLEQALYAARRPRAVAAKP